MKKKGGRVKPVLWAQRFTLCEIIQSFKKSLKIPQG